MSEDGRRVGGASASTQDSQGQRDEHEFVASFLHACRRERLELRIVDEGDAEVGDHGMHAIRPGGSAHPFARIHQVPHQHGDVTVADELGARRVQPRASWLLWSAIVRLSPAVDEQGVTCTDSDAPAANSIPMKMTPLTNWTLE